jgi:hypothetical protein
VPALAWDWTTFRSYLDGLLRQGLSINVAPLGGHGTVRLLVMGPGDTRRVRITRFGRRRSDSKANQAAAAECSGGAPDRPFGVPGDEGGVVAPGRLATEAAGRQDRLERA